MKCISLLLSLASSLLSAQAALYRNPLDVYSTPRVAGGAGQTYVSLTDPRALNPDGSQYGIGLCLSPGSTKWMISMQGGGWCYNEDECMSRAWTRLGSNATWASEASQTFCDASSGVNEVNGFYGDGASRSGYREQPWPVPSNASFPGLYFRGAASQDAMLDYLLSIGMNEATEIVYSGGSAGGLTVFLHLDHVAERMKTEAPNARVVGEPVRRAWAWGGGDWRSLAPMRLRVHACMPPYGHAALGV